MLYFTLFNIFAALFIFGFVVSFLGTIKLPLAEKLALNDSQIGRLITINQSANLLGTLLAGYWLINISHRLVLGLGYFLIILSFLWLRNLNSRTQVLFPILGFGVGGSFLNVTSNALLPILNLENPNAFTNLAHACFGIGALSLPILLGILLTQKGWKTSLKILGIISLFPAVVALLGVYPQVSEITGNQGEITLVWRSLLTLIVLAIFCYVGIEVSLGIWISTYLKKIGWPELKASSLVALFWLGMVGGRLIGGLLFTNAETKLFLLFYAGVLVITLLAMTTLRSPVIGVVIVFLCGLGCGPIFPTLASFTLSQFHPSLGDTVYAIIASMGMLGSTIFPYLIGWVSTRFSIYYGLRLLIMPAVFLFGLIFYF